MMDWLYSLPIWEMNLVITGAICVVVILVGIAVVYIEERWLL